MTVEERRAYWEQQVSAQAGSGLPVRAWCRQAGVAYGTFSYWRRRVQSESPSASLTLIAVVDEAASPTGLCIVVGGARIEVAQDFDGDLLRRVVAALSPC